MIVGIHQAHYFPWLGYMDKMLKSDKFVILDEVQLEISSPMLRNKFLDSKGVSLYLNVDISRKGYLNKPMREIQVLNTTKWQKKHNYFFLYNYKKSPYFDEVYPYLNPIFTKDYSFLIDIETDSVLALKEMFQIPSEIIFQSSLPLDKTKKNNEMLIDILNTMNCNQYLSGNGAKKYMDVSQFNAAGISVAFQDFTYPVYTQYNTQQFVTNLSALDLLFNLGIERSSTLLRKNMKKEVFAKL